MHDSAGTAFASTQWSIVFDARKDSSSGRDALQQLCTAYWLPIYGYLRADTRRSPA